MKPVFVSSVLAVALFSFGSYALAQDGRGAAPAAPATAARGPQPTPSCGPNLTIKNVDKQSRCFELRTYTATPGKLDALNARFRDHTCALFRKHGMEIVGPPLKF